MDQDATPPGPSATLEENEQPRPTTPTGVGAYAEPFGCLTPLVDPGDKRSRELAKPTRYPYTHSFWQEVVYAHNTGPQIHHRYVESSTEEPTVDDMAQAPIGDAGLPIRYVFRHCPTNLNVQGIAQAWRDTLGDEAALQQQLSSSLFDRTAQVLSLEADGWPLYFCERRDLNVQTMPGLTALLSWSAEEIEQVAQYAECGAGSRGVGDVGALPQASTTLPCRLAIVSGPPAYAGILLVAQQYLCDSQTLQFILARFWRRYQGMPKLLPQWSDSFPDAKQTMACLNYWHEVLFDARFCPLPYDVSDRSVPDREDPYIRGLLRSAPKEQDAHGRHSPGRHCQVLPAVNTTARFVTEEQWRLIQQASAVLGVDVESVMLSAFSRWLMQITQSESALFGVLAVRSPTAPVSPPELKPFSVQANGSQSAGQWVKSIAEQLTLSRQYAMPHLANLAQSLGQTPYSLSQLLLEAIFCFEYIQVDWPEALAPITSFGNTNGQLGTHSRLQLTIDITEARMRLIWWGASQYISQAQLQAFEKSFNRTLMDMLRAVLQFNQWTCLEPPHKQSIVLNDQTDSGQVPAILGHENFLQQLEYWVSVAPESCGIATERSCVSRVVLWLAAALFAQETLRGHPQFSRNESHHPVLLLTDDPVAITLLMIAAQMSLLVPMIVTVDARVTLLGDAQHPAWSQCAMEWLLTTCQVTDVAAEHVVVVSVDVDQFLLRAERFVDFSRAQGISLAMLGQMVAGLSVTAEQDSAHMVQPLADNATWQAISAFFRSAQMQQARHVSEYAPVVGYFDPIASSPCQRRIVTHSGYWRHQAAHLLQIVDQSSERFFQVMQVGQALDHAGLWPCFSAMFAGLPLLWIMPETLLAPSAELSTHVAHAADGGRSADVLPASVRGFLAAGTDDSVKHLSVKHLGERAHDVASQASVQFGEVLCFLPELCYALLASVQRFEPVFKALDENVRIILIGEGRLHLPASQRSVPPILLSACEREAVRAPVAHAGDSYTSAGRLLLGFVRPMPARRGKVTGADGVMLGSLLPKIKASAAGNQRDFLDYCRSTLRLDVEGVWSVEMPRSARERALFKLEHDAADTGRQVLRWELGATVILRGRRAPIIELEDRQFSPVGGWSAACRFWERIVSDCLPVGWVIVRPESQTLGQASVRIVPEDATGMSAKMQAKMMAFARTAAWARVHLPAGRYWGVGVSPRWDEILGPKPKTATAPPLAQSMTLARLTERILQLPATPHVTQTWAELGGDWFALFRLTFVLRRLGWTWTLPIRSLHQPLARFALQLARPQQQYTQQVPQSAEEPLGYGDIPPGVSSPRDDVQSSFLGSTTPPLQTTQVHSLDLSAYQLGVFRRCPQSLSQQVYRLQFYYSGTFRAAQLRATLSRWVTLFPPLTGFFELTGQGMQQRVLSCDASQSQGALPWSELLEQALVFQHEPFQSAYLEKLCLEENCQQMQLGRPPLWRCIVYPKGQGRWSVWLMAHKLLFDSREWLDSIRCLELLLFENMDMSRMLPWLDTQVTLRHTQWRAALKQPAQPASQSIQIQALPAHVQATVARFWQWRLELGCQPLVDAAVNGPVMEDHMKTVIQPLPEALNGAQWRALVAGTGLDRLTLLLWAVVQGLMNYRRLTAFRMDLDVPWSSMGATAPEILTGQSGPIPLFLTRDKTTVDMPLTDFKQQLYDQLMAPNPESLLIPGNLAFEQFYDALFQQDVCFSYVESLPENAELSSQADIEQFRRYWPCEFLESRAPYFLKIEAFPSGDRFMLAWRFDASLMPASAVTTFVDAVDAALTERLAYLAQLQQSIQAQAAAATTTATTAREPTTTNRPAEKSEKEKRARERDARQALMKTKNQFLCPIDFGMSGWPASDWSRFAKRFPTVMEVWQPMAVNAWAFKYSLRNPLAHCRGSQATRCPAVPVDAFRARLKTLSMLVPEVAARWAVFPGGSVVLVKTADNEAAVRRVPTRAKWDASPPPAAHQDDDGLVLPCVFTVYYASQHTMLVRCDYDLRAFEPGLVSALLSALAAGSLRPLKAALPSLWLTNAGLGFPRITRLQLNMQYQLNQLAHQLRVQRQQQPQALGMAVGAQNREALTFPFQSYDQVRATYWQRCFAPLVGAAHLRAWLPLTQSVEVSALKRFQQRAALESDVARRTTLTVVSDQLCTLQDQTLALVCVLQTIRRYLLRLWGEQRWVVHLLFADRASLKQVGLEQHWAQHPNTSPHCWMPVYLGDGHVSVHDTEDLLAQLQCSSRYPLESEAELCGWLDWPQEGLSDIVLVIADGEPAAAALQDWSRLLIAPLQFQWNPQAPSMIDMVVHKGVALVDQATALPLGEQRPLTILAKQALHFPDVQQTQARILDLARVTMYAGKDADDLKDYRQASSRKGDDTLGERARQLKILDVRLTQFPERPGEIAHQIQNYLAARLNAALLPDLVRLCDAHSWGEAGCYRWLAQLHGTHQSQLKARSRSALFQPERSAKVTTSRADYRDWFWPVGEDLPGWQAERARASLLAVDEVIPDGALSIGALRTMHHWAQWSDGGRRSRRQRGVKLTERRWALTPDQACWLAMSGDDPAYFNAQLLLQFAKHDVETLIKALHTLVLQDPIFRLQFCPVDGDQTAPDAVPSHGLQQHGLQQFGLQKRGLKRNGLQQYGVQQFSGLSDAQLLAAAIERVSLPSKSVEQVLDGVTRVTLQWQSRFDLLQAPLVRLIVFDCGQQRGPYLALLGSRLVVDQRGLRQLATRLDALLAGQEFANIRSWQQWLAFLAQQRNQVRQLPVVSRLFAAGIRYAEESLYARACEVLNISLPQLMASRFENRLIRRQFLPAISDAQAQSLCLVEQGLQDARSVLCLSCLGLALGNWLGLPEVVIGQWWPVRSDSRAQHWQEVVGSFEFVFKNKMMLMNDCPAETAQRLFHDAPSALQDAISDALARDQFEALDAYSLFSFERIDEQVPSAQFQHAQVVQHALGPSVAGQFLRRSLIRIEASFGSGQLDLRWVYDSQLVPVSFVESLVTRFSVYWKQLRERLASVTHMPLVQKPLVQDPTTVATTVKAPSAITTHAQAQYTQPVLTERVAQALLTQVPSRTRDSVMADRLSDKCLDAIDQFWLRLPYWQLPLVQAPSAALPRAALTRTNAAKVNNTKRQGEGDARLPRLFTNSLVDGSQVWAELNTKSLVVAVQQLVAETLGLPSSSPLDSTLFCASLLWNLFLAQSRPVSQTVFGVMLPAGFNAESALRGKRAASEGGGVSQRNHLAIYPLQFDLSDLDISFRGVIHREYSRYAQWFEVIEQTSPAKINALWVPEKRHLSQGSGLLIGGHASGRQARVTDSAQRRRSPFALSLHCAGPSYSEWSICFATRAFGSVDARHTMQSLAANFMDTVHGVLATPDASLQKVLPLLGARSNVRERVDSTLADSAPVSVDEEEPI